MAQVLNGPGCLYKLAQSLMIGMSVGIPSLACITSGCNALTKICHTLLACCIYSTPLLQRAGQCGSGSEWSRMPIQTCTGPKDRYVHGYTEFGMKGHRLHCYIANYNIISLLYLYSSSAPCWSIKGHGNVVNGP